MGSSISLVGRPMKRWIDSVNGCLKRFLAGNREAELKPTTLSSLIVFCVFLSSIFS